LQRLIAGHDERLVAQQLRLGDGAPEQSVARAAVQLLHLIDHRNSCQMPVRFIIIEADAELRLAGLQRLQHETPRRDVQLDFDLGMTLVKFTEDGVQFGDEVKI
jgi:hypothetical protein